MRPRAATASGQGVSRPRRRKRSRPRRRRRSGRKAANFRLATAVLATGSARRRLAVYLIAETSIVGAATGPALAASKARLLGRSSTRSRGPSNVREKASKVGSRLSLF